jgi:hypothetical protein
LVREQKLVYEQLVKMEDDTVSPLEAVPAGKNRISVAADTIIAREKSIEPAQPLSREVSYAGLSHVWNASPMQKGGIYTPLNAKAETAMAGYYAAIKKKYYSLMHESYVDYNDLLSLVRGKISRIKSKIRQYVIGNF